MTERYLEFFKKSAILASEMSYCKRRKVGAIIVREKRIIVNSWNGTVSGEDNCCEEDYGSESEVFTTYIDKPSNYIGNLNFRETYCKEYCEENGLIFIDSEETFSNTIKLSYKRPAVRTKASVVHAEANAIYFAAKKGIPLEGASMFVTLSPCINCANAIIQSGIKEVYYLDAYRDSSGLEHLKKHNIKIQKL